MAEDGTVALELRQREVIGVRVRWHRVETMKDKKKHMASTTTTGRLSPIPYIGELVAICFD